MINFSVLRIAQDAGQRLRDASSQPVEPPPTYIPINVIRDEGNDPFLTEDGEYITEE